MGREMHEVGVHVCQVLFWFGELQMHCAERQSLLSEASGCGAPCKELNTLDHQRTAAVLSQNSPGEIAKKEEDLFDQSESKESNQNLSKMQNKNMTLQESCDKKICHSLLEATHAEPAKPMTALEAENDNPEAIGPYPTDDRRPIEKPSDQGRHCPQSATESANLAASSGLRECDELVEQSKLSS